MGSREDEKPERKKHKFTQAQLSFKAKYFPPRVESLEETCEKATACLEKLRETIKAKRSDKENKPKSERRDKPKAERRDEENEQTTQEPKRFKQSNITGSLQVRMMVTLLGSTLIE